MCTPLRIGTTTYPIRVSRTIESMKARGMPGNEAARLNQYLWILQSRFEKLRRVKEYRTPQGGCAADTCARIHLTYTTLPFAHSPPHARIQVVRSFARINILILPIFYAPYYLYIAGEGNSANGTGNPSLTQLSLRLCISVCAPKATRPNQYTITNPEASSLPVCCLVSPVQS